MEAGCQSDESKGKGVREMTSFAHIHGQLQLLPPGTARGSSRGSVGREFFHRLHAPTHSRSQSHHSALGAGQQKTFRTSVWTSNSGLSTAGYSAHRRERSGDVVGGVLRRGVEGGGWGKGGDTCYEGGGAGREME